MIRRREQRGIGTSIAAVLFLSSASLAIAHVTDNEAIFGYLTLHCCDFFTSDEFIYWPCKLGDRSFELAYLLIGE